MYCKTFWTTFVHNTCSAHLIVREIYRVTCPQRHPSHHVFWLTYNTVNNSHHAPSDGTVTDGLKDTSKKAAALPYRKIAKKLPKIQESLQNFRHPNCDIKQVLCQVPTNTKFVCPGDLATRTCVFQAHRSLHVQTE